MRKISMVLPIPDETKTSSIARKNKIEGEVMIIVLPYRV